MTERHPVADFLEPLTQTFVDAGKSLYLVGGIVRGLELGQYQETDDLDLTTNARPADIKAIIDPVVTTVWTQGERFGTIGARMGGRPIEITTHRAESYTGGSRKPEVQFGDDLETDLSRRDFTINAMAIELPGWTLVDPYGGRQDLAAAKLCTPLDPEISFGDDPLRILRAARFIARFDLTANSELAAAAETMRDRLSIVSIERVQTEIELLLQLPSPARGLDFLEQVGVAEVVFGELNSDAGRNAGGTEDAPLLVRRAGLIAHGGEEAARQWLKDKRYPGADIQQTSRVVGAAHALNEVEVSAPAIRQFVADTKAANVEAVVQLAKARPDIFSDPTALHVAIGDLAKTEDLTDFSPPLSGDKIMKLLGVGPSEEVGEATKFLQAQRIQRGPLSGETATELLKQWWNERSITNL